MEINVKEGYITSTEIVVSNGDINIPFNASPYGSGTFKKFDVFHYFNLYMKTKDEAFNESVFTYMINIKNALDSIFEPGKLAIELTKQVTPMLNLFSIQDMVTWINFKSDIILPPHFETKFTEDIDKATTREQTYLRSDYANLVAVSLILRVMVPIWSEYISRVRQDSGTMRKEYVSGQLVVHSNIYKSEVIDKLSEYIEVCVNNNHFNNPSLILGGVSSEDFLDWMTSLVIIRRLAVGDVRGLDPKVNLITSVYSYITQRVSPDGPAASEYREKTMTTSADSGMDIKLSVLEQHKVKHDVALGDIVELEYSVSDIYNIAYRLEPRMTDAILNNALATSKLLLNKRLLDPQITVLKWVFSPIISPRGLMTLSKEVVVSCLGVAQAVLWVRDHKLLSLFVTTYVDTSDELMLTGVDSRARIPKEILLELDKYYPYVRKSSSKNKNKVANVAHQSIDKLVDDMSKFNWMMSADKSLILESTGGRQHSNRLIIPHDIKIQVAKFVLDIVNRKAAGYRAIN